MDIKKEIYKKACSDYNKSDFLQCANNLIILEKDYKLVDFDLLAFTIHNIAKSNNSKDVLNKCIGIVCNNIDKVDEKNVKILERALYPNKEEYAIFYAILEGKLTPRKRQGVEERIDFKKLKNSNIINVYYNKSSSGIGDFLRGSCYLFELLNKHNIPLSIDFSKHYVGKYITGNNNYKYEDIFDTELINKENCIPENYVANMEDNLCKILNSNKKVKSLFSNYSTFMYVENKKKIEYEIGNDCKQFMIDNLKFNDAVVDAFNSLDVKDFKVLHFRLGDRELLSNQDINFDNNNINTKKFFASCEDCFDIIMKESDASNNPILLLSDSNKLKQYVKDNITNKHKNKIICVHTKSDHCSDNPGYLTGLKIDSEEKLDNMFYVALDMKIVSEANEIKSYSVYPWGSAFCFWLAKIFSVPISCKVIT
tara:strand:+ start:719 stop:1990 length:1272 start_codon:yes stop_codon:yes gene_type:complete